VIPVGHGCDTLLSVPVDWRTRSLGGGGRELVDWYGLITAKGQIHFHNGKRWWPILKLAKLQMSPQNRGLQIRCGREKQIFTLKSVSPSNFFLIYFLFPTLMRFWWDWRFEIKVCRTQPDRGCGHRVAEVSLAEWRRMAVRWCWVGLTMVNDGDGRGRWWEGLEAARAKLEKSCHARTHTKR
jgi:hypothetical protein